MNRKEIIFNKWAMVMVCIYILIQILPPLFVLDSTTLKYFFFALANCAGIIGLLYYKKKNNNENSSKNNFSDIFCSKTSYIFLLLFLWMAISVLWAMNRIESLVVINRWLIVFLMFIYLSIFLKTNPRLVNVLINLTLIVAIYNVLWFFIAYYYCGINYNPRNIAYLNGFYGNKNIYAVLILFKLPLLYYAFLFRRKTVKWLSLCLIFFLCMSLMVLSARASYISLILHIFMLIAYSIWGYLKDKKKKFWSQTGLIIVFIVCGFVCGNFFVSYNYNHYVKGTQIAKDYGFTEDTYSATTRFKSIEEGNSHGRLLIWRNTLTIIKDNPLKGYGIGNHKLAIMRVETPQKTNFIVSDHAHNDFLEMTSELGIAGFILYCSVYLMGMIMFVKTQKKEKTLHWRFISFVGLLFLMTYMIDAVFNFPAERACCQLYFALGLSFLLVSYLKTKKNEHKPLKYRVFIIIALITLPITYIETVHFISSIMQKAKILQHNGSKSVNYSAEQWEKMFPFAPNIDENTNPIALTIGSRYAAEKKFRQAINIIKYDSSNPYFALKEYRLSNYYFNMGKLDSAVYWADRTLKMKPKCYDAVRIKFLVNEKLGLYKDNKILLSNYLKINQEPNAWRDLIETEIKLKDFSQADSLILCAKSLFTENKTFENIKTDKLTDKQVTVK